MLLVPNHGGIGEIGIERQMEVVFSFQDGLSDVGSEEGERKDAADVALIEAGGFRQSALIRDLAAKNTLDPVMGPSHGIDQWE